MISNIFWIIFICSIIVLISVSFVKGRFDFNLFNNAAIIDFVNIEQNKDLDIILSKDIDSTNSIIQKNLDTKDIDKPSKIISSDDDLMKVDQKIINNKIHELDSLIEESESEKDIKNLKNKKQKSNFI